MYDNLYSSCIVDSQNYDIVIHWKMEGTYEGQDNVSLRVQPKETP